MTIYDRLDELSITLPEVAPPELIAEVVE
jgi:hypothetical protein